MVRFDMGTLGDKEEGHKTIEGRFMLDGLRADN